MFYRFIRHMKYKKMVHKWSRVVPHPLVPTLPLVPGSRLPFILYRYNIPEFVIFVCCILLLLQKKSSQHTVVHYISYDDHQNPTATKVPILFYLKKDGFENCCCLRRTQLQSVENFQFHSSNSCS